MTAFLHGVESLQLSKGPRKINVVKSAVIALVGTAPKGPIQALTLVSNLEDAKQFGSELDGFTIPQALSAIFKQGTGIVLVVNVVDPAVNILTATAESHVITSRKIKTTYQPIGAALVLKNSGGSTTYVLGTDYTIDDFGNITITNNTLAEGVTLKATYVYYDTTTVGATDIVGAIDGTSGVKTGGKLFQDAYTTFGFKPKLILIPMYCGLTSVATEMLAMCAKYRAIGAVDAPVGTTVAGAITGRGPSGTIQFNSQDKRLMLLHPALKVLNPAGSVINAPYSQYFMGVVSAVDFAEGYWVSPSNHAIEGVLGTEIAVSWDPSDSTTQANQLNANGITTAIQRFPENSSLLKTHTWGNRSAAFPTNDDPYTFMCGQRVLDIIDDSVDIASVKYIDKSINKAFIDQVLEDVNAFIRVLVGRGALIDGKAIFDPAKNAAADLAAGKFTISKSVMFPTPAEHIVHETFVDTSFLAILTN